MDNKEKLLTLIDRYINSEGVVFYPDFNVHSALYSEIEGVAFRRFEPCDYFKKFSINNIPSRSNENNRIVREAILDDVNQFVDERLSQFRELHKEETGVDSKGFEFNEIEINFKEGKPNLKIFGKTEAVIRKHENLKIDLTEKGFSNSFKRFWKGIPKEAEFDIITGYYKIKGYKMVFGEIEVDLTIEEADDIYFKILDLSEGSRLRNSELALNQRLEIYG